MVLVVAAVGIGSTAAASPPASPCLDVEAARLAVASINALRANGAPCATAAVDVAPLVWDLRLAATAAELATDLAARDELSHLDAQQRPLAVRLAVSGYAARSAGENLAAGQHDFEQALDAWAKSPGHCANLMSTRFDEIGLACVERKGTRYERFWVAQLGRR